MIQLHHLHRSPVAPSDFGGQFLPEDRYLLAIGRANMRRKVPLGTLFPPVRSKQEQFGKLTCCEPRHSTAVVNAPECQAPVTSEAVPAQIGALETFAAHGLDGIPEDRLNVSDLCEHARSQSAEPKSYDNSSAIHAEVAGCPGFAPFVGANLGIADVGLDTIRVCSTQRVSPLFTNSGSPDVSPPATTERLRFQSECRK